MARQGVGKTSHLCSRALFDLNAGFLRDLAPNVEFASEITAKRFGCAANCFDTVLSEPLAQRRILKNDIDFAVDLLDDIRVSAVRRKKTVP